MRILKQSQSALFCIDSHVTILPVTTHAIDVRNQTSQVSVTVSCPLRDCSGQVVHRPHNVKSADAHQLKAFQSDLRANF